MAPKSDERPAKCKLEIAKSTDPSNTIALNGGYTVHPVPAPEPTNAELSNSVSDGGNNQKLKLFNRGNAISGAPSINGRINYQNHQSLPALP